MLCIEMSKRVSLAEPIQTTTSGRCIGSLSELLSSDTRADHEIKGSLEQTCECTIETSDHLVWECEKARVAWKCWVDKWLGQPSTPSEREGLKATLATKQAPAMTSSFLKLAQ